jgi:aspartyl-tRNA(Asn)/glutamyl-tRNA(Gln) amidotransferase subunit C
LAQVVPVSNAFREDEVKVGLPREASLANAPARQEGNFVVPRII